ncbi:MAG: YqeG family HAD IIIA-type phosphatase [Firmicutes bacterium]|nr:YqeG family HAD IIIA-type phosphatase [Bacillota bacterium]
MIERFCPDEVHRSLSDIDLSKLWQQGIRGIILDVDNTIVRWDSSVLPTETLEWIADAKERGFRLCIASNGVSRRVKALAREMDIPAIAKAVKPRKKPFRSALELLRTGPEETMVIGDQVFTDVFGGNRLNLYTVLINPLGTKELRTTRLMRRLERSVIRRLHKKGYLSAHQLKSRQVTPKGKWQFLRGNDR